MRNNPLLPVEEEGRLGDPGLRENFIQRVYVLYRWKLMLAEGLTPSSLTNFHARHKLIIMSHEDYRDLGQLLAGLTKANLADVAEQYILQLMTTLKKIATRKNHVNVLQHIQGYLKKALSADDKAELCEVIERYRNGYVPLIVPLTLLKHHFRKSTRSVHRRVLLHVALSARTATHQSIITMAKILIVGCGAIGSELAGVLSAQGHDVTGLKRKPPLSASGPIRYVAADISSAADLADLDTDFTAGIFYRFA